MVSRLQRRLSIRRKLHLLRSVVSHKLHGRQVPFFWDTFIFIHMLKLKLEAIEREYSDLLAMKREYFNLVKPFPLSKEVKVEKLGEKFLVKVSCEKGEDRLVSILEAFEKLGLTALKARVSCTDCFSMEAIVIAEDGRSLSLKAITQALTVAIDDQKETANEVQQISNDDIAEI